ncbi:unnamed protein product [Staurois parvus]|uniref:Uncharacterized protein n=1 Tax=Staurois parvus TaxID=386267 RepID=A0ABN9FAI4_9NEOB|nr:unnamed protein product [Staurois parvus]
MGQQGYKSNVDAGQRSRHSEGTNGIMMQQGLDRSRGGLTTHGAPGQ